MTTEAQKKAHLKESEKRKQNFIRMWIPNASHAIIKNYAEQYNITMITALERAIDKLVKDDTK